MKSWYTEKHTKFLNYSLKVKKWVHKEKSKFQEAVIFDSYEFGRVLLLDGLVMLTERDEFIYHEMISHIPLFTHPNPENILIIGGGDGGTVREVLKHKTIKKVTLVEIDKLVIDLSKKYLPFTACRLEDSKVEICIEDGIKYVAKHKNEFDIIIIDSTDPIGPATGLFEAPFLKNVHKSLKPDGIMVAQCGPPFLHLEIVKNVYEIIKPIYQIVRFYTAFIPTYPSGFWSFAFASKKYDPIKDFRPKRYKNYDLRLKYYNNEIHKGTFALPNFIKNGLV